MNDPDNISGFLQTDIGLQILDHSPDKVFVLGKNYSLKYFNPKAEKFAFLFGYVTCARSKVNYHIFVSFDCFSYSFLD